MVGRVIANLSMWAILLCLAPLILPPSSALAQLQDPAFPWALDGSSATSFPQPLESANSGSTDITENQPARDRSVASSKSLSLHINPDTKPLPPLPQWCKPASARTVGPWHLLSDDEYTNESPYLLCGKPGKTLQVPQSQRPSHRRAAHGKMKGATQKVNFTSNTLSLSQHSPALSLKI